MMLLFCLAVLCLIGNISCAAVPRRDTAGHGNKALLDYDRNMDTPYLEKMHKGRNPEINGGHLVNAKHMPVARASREGTKHVVDARSHAVTGLSAMAVFLAVVFIVTTAYTLWKRSKKRRGFKHAAEDDVDVKQTNF